MSQHARREFQEKRVRQQVLAKLRNDQTNKENGKKSDFHAKFNLSARKRKGAPESSDNEDSYQRRGIGIDKLTNKSSKFEQDKLNRETQKFLQESRQRRAYERVSAQVNKRAKLMEYSAGDDEPVDTEENDYLTRLRGQDAIDEATQKQHKETKSENKERTRQLITKARLFIVECLNRAKQSKHNLRNGKEPLNQYDTLVSYPLDVQSIPKQLGADDDILEGFEILHKKIKRVFDVVKDAKEDKKSKNRKNNTTYNEDGNEGEYQDFELKPEKGYEWIQLRNIGLKDIAYMSNKAKSVGGIEQLLEKENKYQELKEKLHKKHVTNKRLNYKTNKGQPLMRSQMDHLLGKIKKSIIKP